MKTHLAAFFGAGLSAALLAQSAAPARPAATSARPAAPQTSVQTSEETTAIVNGRVVPVSGPPIERGTVLIRGRRIAAVGANVAVPAGAKVVDAAGKIVTPGL